MDKLPVNWFDALLLGLLILGLFRGRKHGMSRELLPVLKWLTVVLVAGFFYPMTAELLSNTAGMRKLPSYICGYLVLAAVVILIFMGIKKLLSSRMGENNFFGSGEYYLGMMSGMVRFSCMLIAVLAVLNAPYYTQADIKEHEAYVKRWYGGGLYSGNYFPDVNTIQDQVFKRSFTGPYLKDFLKPILVVTAPASADKPQPKQATVHIQK